MASPTEKTLAHWRGKGYIAHVLERWNPYAKIRQDIGGADVEAYNDEEVVRIQTTTQANHAARRTKALANPDVGAWVAGPNRRFLIESWNGLDRREEQL